MAVYGEPKKRVDGNPEGRKVVGLGYEAPLERSPGVTVAGHSTSSHTGNRFWR